MHKILVLTKHPKEYLSDFIKIGNEKSCKVECGLYEDVSAVFKSNDCSIFIGRKDLRDYDLIYFRGISNSTREIEIMIAKYCAYWNVSVVDEIHSAEGSWTDGKALQYTQLGLKNLPIIDSYYISRNTLNEYLGEMSFPCVVKKADLNQGKGVFLCESKNQLNELFLKFEHSHLLVQNLIKSDSYLRVIVIGGEVSGAVERFVEDGAEKRQGISKHSGARLYELSKEEEKLCLEITQAMGYDVAGIDLIYDHQSQSWKVLEINITPQFLRFVDATKQDVPKKIMNLLISRINNSHLSQANH